MSAYTGIRMFLSPPHFHDDEKNRIAGIVHACAVAILVGLCLLLIIPLLSADLKIIPSFFAMTGCSVASILLNRRGRIGWASSLLVWALLGFILYLIVLSEGIHDTAIFALPGTLVLAGLVLKKRYFHVVTVVSLVSVGLIGYLEISGVIRNSYSGKTTFSHILDVVVIIGITAVTIRLMADHLRKSLVLARESEKAQRLHADQLKEAKEALLTSVERFKLSMDATNDGLWDWNINTDDGYFSPAYYHMLGYDPDTFSAEGRIWKDLIHPEDREQALRVNMDCIEGRRETFEVEYRMKARDGGWRWILGRGKCITRDEHGRALRLLGTHVDITDRKMTEQLLRDMQRRESISILSAGIAHDYNNLLCSMMGNVSLAQSQMPVHHPALKNMEKALSAMERASELTQQVLAYAGKGKFEIRTMDIAAMIRDHVSLFAVSLPGNVSLTSRLPSAPVYVNGDASQIGQIIMNLIINGSEAIGDTPGVVTIALAEVTPDADELVRYSRISNRQLQDGAYALIEVTDTGHGMTIETQAKVFDPFFTTKFTGRGLGLSAVLGIIQGHSGGITVESREAEGTTFRVLLPAAAAPTGESAGDPETGSCA